MREMVCNLLISKSDSNPVAGLAVGSWRNPKRALISHLFSRSSFSESNSCWVTSSFQIRREARKAIQKTLGPKVYGQAIPRSLATQLSGRPKIGLHEGV